MFISTAQGAAAPTGLPAVLASAVSASAVSSPASSASEGAPSNPVPPNKMQDAPEPVRHMLFGSLSAVRTTIKHLHKLNYAEANDWSQPISTGRVNEVMAILTKRINSH